MRLAFAFVFSIIVGTNFSQQSEVITFGKTDQSVYGWDGLIDHKGNHVFGYVLDDHSEIAYIDSNYNTVWVKNIGNAGSRQIAQIDNGNYINIGGKTIFSFDTIGNILWVKVLPEYSLLNEIIVLDTAHIIISFRESAQSGIMCIDSDGNVNWIKQIINPFGYEVWVYDIFKLNDGNFGFITEIKENLNSTKHLLTKMTPNSNIVTQHFYASTNHLIDINTAYQASNDEIYLIGNVLSKDSTTTELKDIIVLKLDNNGTFITGKRFGYNFDDEGLDIKETKNHDFLVFGNSKPKLICGGNLSILRIDSNLDTLWTKYYGTLEANGAYYRYLRTNNDLFYSYGYGSLWTTINNNCDAHVIKSDENFELECFKYQQILNVNSFTDLQISNSNVTYQNHVITYSDLLVDFPSSIQSADGCTGETLDLLDVDESYFEIYPNPTNSVINIENELLDLNSQVIITNISGNIVGIYKALDSQITIDVEEYSKGIYFVKIEGYSKTYKIIIE